MELLPVVESPGRCLRWQSLILDPDQQRLRVGNSVVEPSRAEFGLLHLLISRRNLPLSKEYIMARLFGDGHGRDLRQVDMFVARLRRLLSDFGLAELIKTINGRGYAVLDDDGTGVPALDAQLYGRETAAMAC